MELRKSDDDHSHPHVALLPGAGIGHLTPFLRLAASLIRHGSKVTLITIHPMVSLAQSNLISRFFSAFPQVMQKPFHVLPLDPTTVNSNDPFFLQWEATRRSVHQLSPLLSSLSPPVCALVSDVTFSSTITVTANLNLPNYLFFSSSARMFSLLAYYPNLFSENSPAFFCSSDVLQIPGVLPMSKPSMPPLLLTPDSLFASIFREDGQRLLKFNGTLINTFERLESNSLDALKGGKVVDGLPPMFTVGLVPCDFEKGGQSKPLKWLDDRSPGSVLYVSFGSRVAMSRAQIRELGNGLANSECSFLWVVKDKVIDKEEAESLDQILGDELVSKIHDKGLVVKEWVNQGEILNHTAVGCFLSHCGWNSVIEAAWHGVPLLAWPQIGDQKVNAEIAEMSGLGAWPKNWGWGGDQTVIKGEEIGMRIKEMMANESLRSQAAQIREEVRKAVGAGGSCDNALKQLMEDWKMGWRI